MPVVRIDIQAGKSTIYKRALLHGVRDAITSELGVSPERVFSRILESPAEDIDSPEGRSDRLTVIDVSLITGRAAEIKERLFAALHRNLGREPGIAKHDIVVVLHEEPGECVCVTPAPLPTEGDFDPEMPGGES